MELELRSVWSPPLTAVSASFGVGVHVVLGADADGTANLIALAIGSRLPRRGSIRLSGTDPAVTPRLRRRIASLLGSETPSGPANVSGWLSEMTELKGFDTAASVARHCPLLEVDRPLGSLSLAESRELALAVALGQPDPALVALHDPISCLHDSTSLDVLTRIQELGRQTIVLVTAARVADARRFGGSLYVLERGTLARTAAHVWPDAITPGLPLDLWIDCGAPRELLRELIASPDVRRARFDEAAAGRLRVGGESLERLSEAVARAAVTAGAGIRALGVFAPDLSSVHAASAGLAGAAYKAAQRRALSGQIPTPEAPQPAADEALQPAPPGGSDPK